MAAAMVLPQLLILLVHIFFFNSQQRGERDSATYCIRFNYCFPNLALALKSLLAAFTNNFAERWCTVISMHDY